MYSFELRDIYDDGITMEVTKNTVSFYNGTYIDLSFTVVQFSTLVKNATKALDLLKE